MRPAASRADGGCAPRRALTVGTLPRPLRGLHGPRHFCQHPASSQLPGKRILRCGKAPPLPLWGGGPHEHVMIGRKKSPETEIGILNVRLHQIGIQGRIWTYLAEGYNFVIVSYEFALKKKKKKRHIGLKYKYIYFCVCVCRCCLLSMYKL